MQYVATCRVCQQYRLPRAVKRVGFLIARYPNEIIAIDFYGELTTTAYNPQGNSVAESHVKSAKEALRRLSHKNPREWDHQLVVIDLMYNSEICRSTGFSPFFLRHGYDPVLPPDLGVLPEPEGLSYIGYASKLVQQRREAHAVADQVMREAREKAKAAREKKGKRIPNYGVGSQVWVYAGHEAGMWEPRWKGPFTVVGIPNVYTRELDGLPTGEYPVVHVQRLQEYRRRDAPRPAAPVINRELDTEQQQQVDELIHREEQEERGDVYEVERIEDERVTTEGERRFLIKWKGYARKFNTWEPEENLDHCRKILKEWRSTHPLEGEDEPEEEESEEGDVVMVSRKMGENVGRMCVEESQGNLNDERK